MRYEHYKGGIYRVLNDDVMHTETNERMVLYFRVGSPDVSFVRPYDMFHGYLEDGITKRFVPFD